MTAKTKKPKRGRPPTSRGAYCPHPVRSIGRLSDGEWAEIKAAQVASGLKVGQWAWPVLLAKARRERSR